MEPLALVPVRLEPLTPEEMGVVIDALAAGAGRELPAAARVALLQAAAGVPMLAELLFDDWRQHGEQCLALAVGAMTEDPARAPDHTTAYEQLFARVLRDLSPTARSALHLAAILGDRLNDLSMYDIVDLSLADTLRGMAELTSTRILRDGGKGVEFRNELLRRYTYLEVPSPVRRAVHGRIADRLLAAEGRGEPVPGLMLAWHCYRAGRAAEAEPYLLRGAQETLAKGAPVEAELALGSALPSLSARHRVPAQLALVQALQEQGRWGESLGLLPTTDTAGERWGRLRRALQLVGKAELERRPEAANRLYEEILCEIHAGVAGSVDACLFAAGYSAANMASDIELLRGSLGIISRFTEGSLSLATRINSTRLLALLAYRSRSKSLLLGLAPRMEQLDIERLELGLDCSAVGSMYLVKGMIAMSLGDYNEAAASLRSGFLQQQRLGNNHGMTVASLNQGLVQIRLGEYGTALEWCQRAERLALTCGLSDHHFQAQCYTACAHALRGSHSLAYGIAAALRTKWYLSVAPWMAQRNGLLLADSLLLAGEEQMSLEVATEVLENTSSRELVTGESSRVVRWAYRTQKNPDLLAQLLELEGLDGERAPLDRIDLAETLGVIVRIRQALGLAWSEQGAHLSAVLCNLPEPVSIQLRRLGALP
ncbi:MAG: hypothetical protein IPF77_07415 [Gemmatimonadetes bacterium]|nr:hypothetical protein [Gemmatimonadota bacterium]